MRFPFSAMMIRTQSGILAEIVSQKQQEVAALQSRASTLEQQAHERRSRPRGFAEALRSTTPAIIAEIKKASPRRGVLQPDFHPAFTAHAYEQGGAACISVMTDN